MDRSFCMKEDCEIRPKAERRSGSRARVVGLHRDLWSIFCNSILDNDYDERWEIGGVHAQRSRVLIVIFGRSSVFSTLENDYDVRRKIDWVHVQGSWVLIVDFGRSSVFSTLENDYDERWEIDWVHVQGSWVLIVDFGRSSVFSTLENDYDERWEIGGIRRAGPSGLLKVCGRTWGYGENKQGLHIACVSSNDSATDI